MDFWLSLIVVLFVLFTLIGVFAFLVIGLPLRIWRSTKGKPFIIRLLAPVSGVLFLAAPILGVQCCITKSHLSHVPEPLQAQRIEYTGESFWVGALGPGGNESGVLVFQLTEHSAEWARSQREALSELLEGGDIAWQKTPICQPMPHPDRPEELAPCDDGKGRSAPLDIRFYLRMPLQPPLNTGIADEINRVVGASDSYFKLERRTNAITVVAPSSGKVYFFYSN